MNEKEALTGLKNLSQIFKLCSENDVKLKDFNIMNQKAYKEAIETILDLYNKEKEKNIELEDYKDKFFKLHESYNRVVEKLNNSISKDKIKEKYLEMEQEYARKVYDNNYNRTEVKKEEMYKRQVYEELLEEK